MIEPAPSSGDTDRPPVSDLPTGMLMDLMSRSLAAELKELDGSPSRLLMPNSAGRLDEQDPAVLRRAPLKPPEMMAFWAIKASRAAGADARLGVHLVQKAAEQLRSFAGQSLMLDPAIQRLLGILGWRQQWAKAAADRAFEQAVRASDGGAADRTLLEEVRASWQQAEIHATHAAAALKEIKALVPDKTLDLVLGREGHWSMTAASGDPIGTQPAATAAVPDGSG